MNREKKIKNLRRRDAYQAKARGRRKRFALMEKIKKGGDGGRREGTRPNRFLM